MSVDRERMEQCLQELNATAEQCDMLKTELHSLQEIITTYIEKNAKLKEKDAAMQREIESRQSQVMFIE
jgi:uncharacterized protein YigA (DUF484 family)